MNKKYSILVLVVVIAAAAAYFAWPDLKSTRPGSDPQNATYSLDGVKVTLHNGEVAYGTGDDSYAKTTVRYFGNAVSGDFNNDGRNDVAFLLTQDSGGSGTFFYVVAALGGPDGYVGTNGIFLGDRIAPQTTEFRNGKIIVNYADRKPSDPMTAPASVGISKYVAVQNGALVEVSR